MSSLRELLAGWRGLSVRLRAATVATAVLVVAGAGLVAYLALKRPGDVSNPSAQFVKPEPKRKKPRTMNWPMFGYDAARTKSMPARNVKPPFRPIWGWDSGALMEFSPIVAHGTVYGQNNDGLLFAMDADTGKRRWKKRIGELSASAPAYSGGRLYVITLEPGQVMAFRPKDGKLIWRTPLAGRTESSPVVHNGKVIVGCECSRVYALSAKNGKVVWETPTAGAVKAAVALHKNTVYVGDYGGQMNALDAGDGHVRWTTSDLGLGLGRSGRFYSTAAVAFGRVYAGNVDGRVYSYEASSGNVAWTRSTGDWVYGGVVVADPKGMPPAVFAGSFDRNVYAFNAKTGAQLWSAPAGGIVSGAGSVVGDVYYIATLSKRTYGFNVRTGKRVFKFKTGQYNPVISDGRRIDLTGYSGVTALEPVRKKKAKGKRKGKGKGKGAAKTARGSRRSRGAPSRRARGKSRSGKSKRKAQRQRARRQ